LLLLALVPLVLSAMRGGGALNYTVLASLRRLAATLPTPASPWLAAGVATSLSIYDWTCEGVGALAFVVLLVTVKALGTGPVRAFFVDLFVTPPAMCALALVPIIIALSKRHTRKYPISLAYATRRSSSPNAHGPLG